MAKKKVIILGAGPSGLGAAYELLQKEPKKWDVTVIDKNDRVGGLARTVEYKNNLVDIGPHRFFTKNEEVNALWHSLLGDDFIAVPRLTRIWYRDRFFNYPLKGAEAIFGLGLKDTTHAVLSYAYARTMLRNQEAVTFEQWVTQQFGHKLYSIFFKTYTEKVWGIPCDQIGAEWAGQRIKGLNFVEAARGALGFKTQAKSLVESFYYPVMGAGMMWQTMARKIEEAGGKIVLNAPITKMQWKDKAIHSITIESNGKPRALTADVFLSSIPITELALNLAPKPPAKIIKAAKELFYRDHITVNLIVKGTDLFPDNWIYVHSPDVQMARITNYRNFSPKMIADSNTSTIAVEYFCFTKDPIWKRKDADLIILAEDELVKMNLIETGSVVDGFVMREKDSYPTYYTGHREPFETLKDYFSQFANLQLIGRAGMYKYNNQDHAVLTGMYAARNLMGADYNIWLVNSDAEYHEVKKSN